MAILLLGVVLLVPVVIGWKAAMLHSGRPRQVGAEVVFIGGLWIDGWSVSWPFAQIVLNSEAIEVRPRLVKLFRAFEVSRDELEDVSVRRFVSGFGLRLEGKGIGRVTLWPGNPRAFGQEWERLGWPEVGRLR